ncbi:unnamed protein product, partial [Phaeothamnion confervicola]
SSGGGKEGGDKSVFESLRGAVNEAIDKNKYLKEQLEKLKDAEGKFGAVAAERLRQAQVGQDGRAFLLSVLLAVFTLFSFVFRAPLNKRCSCLLPSRVPLLSVRAVQEQAEKLKGKASEQAGKAGGAFQAVRGSLRERFGSGGDAGGSSNASSGGGSSSNDGGVAGAARPAAADENEFVRASKERQQQLRDSWREKLLAAPWVAQALESTQGFRDGFVETAYDLFGAKPSRRSTVVKRLREPKPLPKKKAAGDGAAEGGAATAEAVADDVETDAKSGVGGAEDDREMGGALLIVKSFGEAWEKLQARLREAPIIQDILGAGRVLGRTPVGQAGKRARDAVAGRIEDAQEAWETSQHPLVYKASSVWDSVTAETEMGSALRELRRLDRSFDIEEWKRDVQEELLPEVMGAFLRGDIASLREWMGEAVYNKLSAEAAQRKKDGILIDPHVLDIRQADVLAIKADADSRNPTIVLQFMCQQIHCVRNRAGEIVEGSEDDIRANYYIFAFQRDFLEQQRELRWKVVDFMLVRLF